ncbi:hypothetical protein [Oceanospirillum maris]|jgi:hypothetical protein|uniref:hypothetical protein n=1 Tax=Oceanospirillum maris TaxID=64977 RepID=UPI00040091CD|nr:hypothetical protein [Oceanospirillum maris]
MIRFLTIFFFIALTGCVSDSNNNFAAEARAEAARDQQSKQRLEQIRQEANQSHRDLEKE